MKFIVKRFTSTEEMARFINTSNIEPPEVVTITAVTEGGFLVHYLYCWVEKNQ